MKKDKDITDVEFIVNDKVENVFTDIIQLHINNETVNIQLAIRDVNNTGAHVSHNVIMTLPHFIRFAEVCKNTSEKIVTQLGINKEK